MKQYIDIHGNTKQIKPSTTDYISSLNSVSDLSKIPLSFSKIIKEYVVGLSIIVTKDKIIDTPYTDTESSALLDILGIDNKYALVDIGSINMPTFKDVLSAEAKRLSDEQVTKGSLEKIKMIDDLQSDVKDLKDREKKLLKLVDELRVEKEQYKGMVEQEITKRHEFVISAQNEHTIQLLKEKEDLLTQVSSMQDKIDDLYIELSQKNKKWWEF